MGSWVGAGGGAAGDSMNGPAASRAARARLAPDLLVSGARLAQVLLQAPRLEVARGLEDVLEPLAPFGVHRPPPSSRNSHARAMVQSRLTVASDTSRAVAVSGP